MVRVLIVEDQIEVRRMLRAALEALRPDLCVMDFPSGEEALLMLSQAWIDLAVFDVRLAGISGLELMRKARQRRPDLKVILITGLSDPVMRQKIAGAGADDFFFKPLDMPAFFKAVDHCLAETQKPAPSSDPEGAGTEMEMEREGKILKLLSGVRIGIGAVCVLLIDPTGLVLARSGDLPAELPLPPLLSSAVSAVRISSEISGSLGREAPQDMMYFSGKRFHLVLLPSEKAALLAVVDVLAPGNPPSDILGRVHPILDEISNLLPSLLQSSVVEEAGVSVAVDDEEDGMGTEIPDLEQFFLPASRDVYQDKDIQAFWEPHGSESVQNDGVGEGRLSYEQAKKLGLTPED